MSVAASALGVDIVEVIAAAATKPYGFMPFVPGPGVGGHCIPCDPHYLLWQLRLLHRRLPLIEQAMTAIAERPLHVVDRVRDALAQIGSVFSGASVLVLGVAYKPDVADVRASPALMIIDALLLAGVTVNYFDPYVPKIVLGDGRVLQSLVTPTSVVPDLVLLHTAHARVGLDWLPPHVLFLNATYRPSGTAGEQMMT